jgi:hypothetical protein
MREVEDLSKILAQPQKVKTHLREEILLHMKRVGE